MKSLPANADAQSWRGSLLQNIAAESEQGGRTTTRGVRDVAGRLHHSGSFHKAAEVLLVQVAA